MQRFWQALKEERQYILIASMVFIVSAVYSYFNAETLFESLKETPVFKQLMGMVKNTEKNPEFFSIFTMLFLNNTQASFILLVSGLFFGLMPFMGVVTNGVILGVVIHQAAKATGHSPFLIFTKYILPHGILELPAFLLAVAMGLRLGVTVIRTFIQFLQKQKEKSIMEWRNLFKRLPVYCVGILVFLFFAAIIESLLILSSIS
ncbi:stage II sporulation protein M [Thermoflavimicrobium dichotomicum]|uniref:Stage II sporulation protein M n=1 Tax=Thermoflavimicrobium dichotomicum TaxID=46223 RepID=A0A1I3QY96_9BACL|nr:stage II sporulation protein M [Thermoflavimicrobium dichotomicum]SFJ39048.1 stage II sporulation protein M [Thermoflavimicrobium dichotomicum]